jgi:hypothetical protein
MPRFKFFLSSRNNPVLRGDVIWSTPIPLSRRQSAGIFKPERDILINHGDYFTAVRDFLERDRCAIVRESVSQYLHQRITPDKIEAIRIFLDKHGELYHPSKIEVISHAHEISFVMNVAVTDVGKQYAQREYRVLKRLNREYPHSYIPKVYAQGTVFTKKDQVEPWMFLGEWFDGFKEFHLSFDPDDNTYKIIVWDDEHGNFFLADRQAMALYRQAMKILTYYYNIETFEQIVSWHHAAGDFIIKCQEDDIELKLVTVRQYRSIYENNIGSDSIIPDSELILESLLVFFLNTAIKMRIDRLDGTGDIVWSDDIALIEMLKGCFEGLDLKPEIGMFSPSLSDCFRRHLLSCSPTDFFDLIHAIVHAYPSHSPEIPVIRQHLGKHVEDLYHAVRQLEQL